MHIIMEPPLSSRFCRFFEIGVRFFSVITLGSVFVHDYFVWRFILLINLTLLCGAIISSGRSIRVWTILAFLLSLFSVFFYVH